MIQEERYDKILALLREKRHLSIDDAQIVLATSESTIRRDFRELERRQLAKRSYGGISLPQENEKDFNHSFELRTMTHGLEKERLARKAAALLYPHATVFLDGGTTTLQLARCLPDVPLVVVTNSLPHVQALTESRERKSNLEIYMVGGYYYDFWRVNLGPQACYCISEFNAQFAFLSGRGICEDGVYNHSQLVVEAERTMISRAEQTVFMMDHSKLGRRSTCFLCRTSEMDVLITSPSEQHQPLFDHFREAGIDLQLLDA